MNIRCKVLCVGVNRVPGLRRLRFAEKDAQTTAKYFETLKSQADVTLLTGKKATRTNILDWVKECRKIQGKLTVIISFAGHGSAEKDENKKKLERCLWINSNPDTRLDSHQLRTSEILNLLNNPLHRLIFLIDACYDFASQQDISIQDIFRQFKESERMIALKQYAIISASAVNQAALEDPRLSHGILTYYFLQTLAGKYTFFLSKKIAFFKFLALLDKKVRNHRFLTDTGRKATLKMLRENGIMVHWHDTNFDLPILEPIPSIENHGKNAFQKKLSRWTHFFKSTRLRRKILSMSIILAVTLLILTLAHLIIVRIHFQYQGPQSTFQKPLGSKTFVQSTKFYNFLLGYSSLFLDKMRPERLGQETGKTFTLYLFKHNWVRAFLRKLDEKGKIILLGNYLGEPIRGVKQNQMLNFALDSYNKDDIFYWHPRDVNRLVENIRDEYRHFDSRQKVSALKLLAKLGEKGKTAAMNIFDFKNETDRELRSLFLEHFYSTDFWKLNFADFNLYDYLYLVTYKKRISFPKNNQPGEKIGQFLHTIIQSLPGAAANTPVTDPGKLREIYGKLKILKHFDSPHFQEKVADILNIAFDPDYLLDLILICKDFNERVWLLNRYFTRGQENDIEGNWWKFTRDLFKKKSLEEKSKMIKFLINTKIQFLGKNDRYDLFWNLRDSDAEVIGLNDWEKWIKTYPDSRYPALIAIIKMKSPRVFPFLENNYPYFKGEFHEGIFEELYKKNNEKTIRLVKKLYVVSSPRDKLCCAIFLYSKNYREYSAYIGNFIGEAKNRKQAQKILIYFHRAITHTLIRMIETNEISKDELKFVIKDRRLFYTFAGLNLRLWPGEVKNVLMAAEIPHDFGRGIPLLRACEKLPEPYRKKMLVKICKADLDETFRLNAESSLLERYPRLFLKLAHQRQHHYNRFQRKRVIEAYRLFSYEELRRELILSSRTGMYAAVGFIREALIKKQEKGEINIKQLRRILQEFNRPVQRMLLRDLRYHVHKRYFQETPADDKNIPQSPVSTKTGNGVHR
jgi:hypothetical protein